MHLSAKSSFKLHRLEIHTNKAFNLSGRKVQHFRSQSRIHPNPERVVHDCISIGQRAADAEVAPDHVGLARQIPGEEQACADLVLVQVIEQIHTADWCLVAQGDGKTEPGRNRIFRGFGQDQEFLAGGEAVFEPCKVGFARLNELVKPIHLRQGAGGLHVADLEVVAEMAIGVFVVVALRQIAQLPAKTLAAGIVLAGRAVTVAAPVAERFGDTLEFVVAGEYGTALAHGDVVGRVKAQGADVAKGADQLAIVGGAQRVAAVFDQPEIVFLCDTGHFGEVVRVAQGVGQHDGLGLWADGGFELGNVDVVGGDVDIDKHRNGTELQDGVNRGGEAGGDADDFVPRFDCAVAKIVAGKCGESNQVGRGTGVDGDQMLDAKIVGESLFEFVVEAAGGQPAVKRGFDHVLEFRRADDFAGGGDDTLTGNEGLGCQGDSCVFIDEGGNLFAKLFCLFHSRSDSSVFVMCDLAARECLHVGAV